MAVDPVSMQIGLLEVGIAEAQCFACKRGGADHQLATLGQVWKVVGIGAAVVIMAVGAWQSWPYLSKY